MPHSILKGSYAATVAAVALSLFQSVWADHELGPQGSFEAPKPAAHSEEGERAIKLMKYPAGWKAELWASEPDVAHGVALDVADDGKVYVAESFRAWRGVPDIRGIMDWLDEDLACKSVDDRLAMMKRHLGDEGMKLYYKNTERVRVLQDTTGDGKANSSKVFADNFATPLDGVAAGVLSRGKEVWFANIPNVWWLKDNDGDGVADARRSISYGYGIRVGFLGHDLHGLTWGPDGKLYFSIGDRAAMVQTEGHTVGNPDCGGVFRCNPDGSHLEMIYNGLRNPQDLVFDEWGDLFTGDNNSDGGDQARWTWLVEGGDSGWRIGWQFLEGSSAPVPRGPWNSEKMWYPQNDVQPAYLTPPIKNISAGPSGVSYYPGTGAGADWNGRFTLADFRGSSGGSGFWQFKLKPKGASFEIVEDEKFIWAVNGTDGHWGPDGAYWLLDWTTGWEPVGKGRIYRFYDPTHVKDPIVKETQSILKAGFAGRSEKELVKLLGHPNYRVRQGAQFTLAEKGESSIKPLMKVAIGNGDQHARLHAIWALGQLAEASRKVSGSQISVPALDGLVAVLGDTDPRIRANTARVLADAGVQKAYDGLIKLTSDPDAHTRAIGTIALSKLGRRESLPAVFAMLRENDNKDPHLRHAGVMALLGANDMDALLAACSDPSPGVRMALVIAFRRLGNDAVNKFLADNDEKIVVEAARAINDVPVSGAMKELAALISKPIKNSDPLIRRVINANYRYGTKDTAVALATFAANSEAPDGGRADALDALATWPKNPGRDRISGLWRPTAFARDSVIPSNALRPVLLSILENAPAKVRAAAATAAGSLQIAEAAPALADLVIKVRSEGSVRVEALKALAALHATELPKAVAAAGDDKDEKVRKLATSLGAASGDGAVVKLEGIIAKGTMAEKQNAFASLGGLKSADSDALVKKWAEQLVEGKVPAELQLDVLEAASKHPAAKDLVAKYTASLDTKDDIANYRVCLQGGNAEEGKKVFVEKAEVSCVRCHKINGDGGEVGPELTGLIGKHDRAYIVQSIIHPNAQIAQGFESVLVSLKNGQTYAGVVKTDNDQELVINSPEDGLMTIKKADIASREKGQSAMPEGFGDILTKQELRSLVEYIANAK
ncbi:MAG TPA: HEAT repeat domain-containing protein [Candidatus Limnocylindria bacterium]|nr:HEAT repeat domain-containing protein [Candidatus Limnocylindria bacterium]